MDLKGLVDKAKSALKSNPDLIEKGGDMVDKATGNKYADKVDKAQDAARKAVGVQGGDQQQGGRPQQGQSQQGQSQQDRPQQGQQPGDQQQ